MHQWYWSYQYPDFLNLDDEFIELDSYLVPESDSNLGSKYSFIDGVFLSSDGSIQDASGQLNEGPNLGNVDVVRERILNQLKHGRDKSVFAMNQPADARLDTPALRQEVVDRYRASGDTYYMIRKVAVGSLKGEDRLCYPTGHVIKPSEYLLDHI